MKTVTDVNTVNQLLTYSKQAEAGIHQKAIQMLLGAGNNKKQDSLSISDAARGFSKQSIAALIDKNANISNSELAYYFANYNNSSAILDAINFGENVSCGYNSDFKEYGVISFDLNGSRQVVPKIQIKKEQIISGKCVRQAISCLIWHRERVCGGISTAMRRYCPSVRKSGFLRDSFL